LALIITIIYSLKVIDKCDQPDSQSTWQYKKTIKWGQNDDRNQQKQMLNKKK